MIGSLEKCCGNSGQNRGCRKHILIPAQSEIKSAESAYSTIIDRFPASQTEIQDQRFTLPFVEVASTRDMLLPSRTCSLPFVIKILVRQRSKSVDPFLIQNIVSE